MTCKNKMTDKIVLKICISLPTELINCVSFLILPVFFNIKFLKIFQFTIKSQINNNRS